MSEQKFIGEVVFFDPRKGWGFIRPEKGDKDVFVQYSHLLMEGFKTLLAGQVVEYELGSNVKGVCATKVVVKAQPIPEQSER